MLPGLAPRWFSAREKTSVASRLALPLLFHRLLRAAARAFRLDAAGGAADKRLISGTAANASLTASRFLAFTLIVARADRVGCVTAAYVHARINYAWGGSAARRYAHASSQTESEYEGRTTLNSSAVHWHLPYAVVLITACSLTDRLLRRRGQGQIFSFVIRA